MTAIFRFVLYFVPFFGIVNINIYLRGLTSHFSIPHFFMLIIILSVFYLFDVNTLI